LYIFDALVVQWK